MQPHCLPFLGRYHPRIDRASYCRSYRHQRPCNHIVSISTASARVLWPFAIGPFHTYRASGHATTLPAVPTGGTIPAATGPFRPHRVRPCNNITCRSDGRYHPRRDRASPSTPVGDSGMHPHRLPFLRAVPSRPRSRSVFSQARQSRLASLPDQRQPDIHDIRIGRPGANQVADRIEVGIGVIVGKILHCLMASLASPGHGRAIA